MTKPIAVITGDVHFTVGTLTLATEAIKACIREAKRLKVPLVLNGDILDGKAILRGECSNRLIELLNDEELQTYVNVGNHSLINEKSSEHVLNFIKPYCQVVQYPAYIDKLQSYVIPYQTSSEILQAILNDIPAGSRLIMHQGVQTAYLGHYTQDKTSLPKESFADFRVIASHYHRRQDIKCGRARGRSVGLFSYIGNPYSLSFGEASDGPKGFSVLYDDGSLGFVPLNLRKHVVMEADCTEMGLIPREGTPLITQEDLVWLKLHGFRSKLDSLDKKFIGEQLVGNTNYKLEKIYTDTAEIQQKTEKLSNTELFDSIIDNISEEHYYKSYLKALWKELG